MCTTDRHDGSCPTCETDEWVDLTPTQRMQARLAAFNRGTREAAAEFAARITPTFKENPMPADHREQARSIADEESGVVKSAGSRPGYGTLHALLAIHDLLDERLPKPKPIDHTIAARNLEAFKHAVSRPMREPEGVKDEPTYITEEPQEAGALVTDVSGDVWWKTFAGCWHRDDPEAPAECSTWAELERGYAPLRLAAPADLDRVGIYRGPRGAQSAPASTETARNGDLSDDGAEQAPTDPPTRERAREDVDRDEALARVIFGDAYGSHEGLRLAQLDVALMARKHIEAEQEDAVAFLREEVESLTRRADGYRAEALQYGRAALDRANERDGWKAKHAALREDVEALRRNPKSLTDVLMRAADILDRDDARDPQAD